MAAVDEQAAQFVGGRAAALRLLKGLHRQRADAGHHRPAAAGARPVNVGARTVVIDVDGVCACARVPVGDHIHAAHAVGGRAAIGQCHDIAVVDAVGRADRLGDAPGVDGAVLGGRAHRQATRRVGLDERAAAVAAIACRVDEQRRRARAVLLLVIAREIGDVTRFPIVRVVVQGAGTVTQRGDLWLVAGVRHAVIAQESEQVGGFGRATRVHVANGDDPGGGRGTLHQRAVGGGVKRGDARFRREDAAVIAHSRGGAFCAVAAAGEGQRIDHEGDQPASRRNRDVGAIQAGRAGGRIDAVADPVDHARGCIGRPVTRLIERAHRLFAREPRLELPVGVKVHEDGIVRAADDGVGDEDGRIVQGGIGVCALIVIARQAGVRRGIDAGLARNGKGERAGTREGASRVDVPAPVVDAGGIGQERAQRAIVVGDGPAHVGLAAGEGGGLHGIAAVERGIAEVGARVQHRNHHTCAVEVVGLPGFAHALRVVLEPTAGTLPLFRNRWCDFWRGGQGVRRTARTCHKGMRFVGLGRPGDIVGGEGSDDAGRAV